MVKVMMLVVAMMIICDLKVSRVKAKLDTLSLHLGNEMLLKSRSRFFFFMSYVTIHHCSISVQLRYHNPVFVLLGIGDEGIIGKRTFSVHFLPKQVVSEWSRIKVIVLFPQGCLLEGHCNDMKSNKAVDFFVYFSLGGGGY